MSSRCDMPPKTYKSALDFIVSEIKPDLIIFGGDNSAHDVYMNTSEEVTNYTIQVSEMLQEAVKGHDITVLPILGNHDTWVETIQSFGAPHTNPEINGFKDHWKEWLSADALDKFSEYGYYSEPIRLANGKGVPAGSRAIVLNTNVCANINWFLYG